MSAALETIRLDHFAFLQGEQTLGLLGGWACLADWQDFATSWDRLELDTYMADGGRYRRRRHATFAALPGERIIRQPHQPHYQTLDYNRLNGGIPRHFQPIEADIAAGASMTTILAFCRDLFEGLSAIRAWHVELHQFRIEAGPGQAGQPTPEGMHRDGVDFVLVLLIGRQNIASGMTTIHDLQKNLLGSFTLTDPLDAALVDDRLVYHGVTPVEPLDASRPAHRDVLVVTFKAR